MSKPAYQRLVREDSASSGWREVGIGIALLLAVALACLLGPTWMGGETPPIVFDQGGSQTERALEGSADGCDGPLGCPDVAAPPLAPGR